jgi:hypothetical protein
MVSTLSFPTPLAIGLGLRLCLWCFMPVAIVTVIMSWFGSGLRLCLWLSLRLKPSCLWRSTKTSPALLTLLDTPQASNSFGVDVGAAALARKIARSCWSGRSGCSLQFSSGFSLQQLRNHSIAIAKS